MKRIILLGLSLILLSPLTLTATQEAKKEPPIVQILKDFRNFFKSQNNKKIKQKVIKTQKSPTHNLTDKAGIIDPNYYRKISSKSMQKMLDKRIKSIANSCDPSYTDPHRRLDIFKSNLIRLRSHLETVINANNVDLDSQMESKDIYNQIKEEDFPALRIIDEEASIKDKVMTLEESFKTFYNYSYQRNESNPKYEDWAEIIIKSITCIDGQSL